MRLSLREYVFVGMLLAMPVIMWYMVFKPQNEATSQMVADIREKSATLARMEKTQQIAVDQLDRDIQLLSDALERMNRRIPDREDTGSLMNELSLLASTNGLNTRAIEPFSSENLLTRAVADRFNTQWIRLELEGDFMSFYAFLQALENQPRRIIRLQTMSLTKSGRSSADEGRVRAVLEMVTFYRVPAPESPKDGGDAGRGNSSEPRA